ncbi:MAG: DUF4859 domain-containing protein [Bacteroidales bacterium]|nr:DUF4859 domain-containing protein [Bacteroidales bacterium]
MSVRTKKNRKQAAYVAPTPEPTPEPTPGDGIVADMTVTFEYEAGAASGKLDGAEITAAAKTALGLEDLAGAQIMGFLADGTMAELQTTVAVEGGYACDGWMTVDGTMTSWGTEHAVCIKPWSTPESMDVFLASTEVGTTAVGYFAYVNGDAKYVVKVNVTVVEPTPEPTPEPGEKIEIEADYVLEVEVAQDNNYGATYIALDGTELGYWGKYSDPAKYVTTIQDVSVDITPEIEAALGIEADGLEDAINGGSVYVGAYGLDENGEVYFRDCYDERGSNFFYWFSEAGYAQGWGDGAFFCIDNIGFHSDAIQLYGTTCMFPSSAQIGSTYSGYVVFKTDDAEYVVEVKGTAVAVPEAQPLPEYDIVYNIEREYSCVYVAEYGAPAETFTLEIEMADIQAAIGGTPDVIMMNYLDENLEEKWDLWQGGTTANYDGWFGANGAAAWGNGSLLCMKPTATGSFSQICCFPDIELPSSAQVTFRYCNSATMKAADVKISATITAE